MKNFFLNVFLVLSITIVLDIFFTYFFISKYNFSEKIYPKLDHRISNSNYHHTFRKNVSTYDYWGKYKYKFLSKKILTCEVHANNGLISINELGICIDESIK